MIAQDSLPYIASSARRAAEGEREKTAPNGEVAVGVVDESGDAAVRVQLQVLGFLVLPGLDAERDVLVLDAELFEDDRHLPIQPSGPSVCHMSGDIQGVRTGEMAIEGDRLVGRRHGG